MKLISGLVRPDRVDQIKAALEKVHVVGMTVTEVRDHWPQDHGTTVWKGHEYKLSFSIKMAIELVVHDDDVHDVVKVIINTARTGQMGDGHVSVLPIEHRYNIRNGERDVS
jgi:nitrogen regulatory protein P-II 1